MVTRDDKWAINATNWHTIEAIQMRLHCSSGDTSLTHYFPHSLDFLSVVSTAAHGGKRGIHFTAPRRKHYVSTTNNLLMRRRWIFARPASKGLYSKAATTLAKRCAMSSRWHAGCWLMEKNAHTGTRVHMSSGHLGGQMKAVVVGRRRKLVNWHRSTSSCTAQVIESSAT